MTQEHNAATLEDRTRVQELANLVLKSAAEQNTPLRLVGAVANLLILECMLQAGGKEQAVAFAAVAAENINVAVQAVLSADDDLLEPAPEEPAPCASS